MPNEELLQKKIENIVSKFGKVFSILGEKYKFKPERIFLLGFSQVWNFKNLYFLFW